MSLNAQVLTFKTSYSLSKQSKFTTYCQRVHSKQSCLLIQDHYQEGFDEKIIRKVSFTKHVLESIDTACTSFLFIGEVPSMFPALCTQ